MGKKLIIKGADFSENGFIARDEVTDASTLYIRIDGVDTVLTPELWASSASSSSTGKSPYETTSGGFNIGNGLFNYSACAMADCAGYDSVEVKTTVRAGGQSTISGVGVILFTDDSNNIKGGITTRGANTESPSGKTTGIAHMTSIEVMKLDVPDGATKVYSTWKVFSSNLISPFDATNGFYMKLHKTVIE